MDVYALHAELFQNFCGKLSERVHKFQISPLDKGALCGLTVNLVLESSMKMDSNSTFSYLMTTARAGMAYSNESRRILCIPRCRITLKENGKTTLKQNKDALTIAIFSKE